MPFYHLRTRSEYSILTSACKLEHLEKWIKENGSHAMCLMDDMSLSAGLKWSMHLQEAGVKPLIGLNVFIGKETYDFNSLYPQLGLIAVSEKGYLNLLKILQCGHFEHNENDFQQKWVKIDNLQPFIDDVICLTGGYRGVVGYEFLNFGKETATDTLNTLLKLFKDNLYIELTRHGRTKEKELEDFLIDYAYKKNIPLVATNDVCFYKRENFKAFDTLACIRDKEYLTTPNRYRLNEEYYLKSVEEMENLFSDVPEAIENTENIVKRCNFLIHKRKPTLPHYCNSLEQETRMMEKMAKTGMEERFQQINWDKAIHSKEQYLERLAYEIGVIEKMGFPGYFLIVADFVQWSKQNGVTVGAGRGSGAGSLVAWCLKITEVDPLEYGLFFERFLNPERVSMPDFDIDFCQENRWKTIDYVIKKYGKDSVARIITYGKMKAKMVIKDVGRVMQISFNDTNEIVKLIPFNPTEPITIEKAIEIVPRLKEERENDPKMKQMLDIAIGLEDLTRNTSMHAAGVVIGDKPLIELGPVCSEENDNIDEDELNNNDDENLIVLKQSQTSNFIGETLDENGKVIKKKDITKQKNITGIAGTGLVGIDWFNSKPENRIAVFGYDMKDCEKIGLVKFDFLGLQTLTVLSKACEMIKQNTGIDIDILRIPTDDEKTFQLLQTGHLKGVFQLETPLPRNALKAIKTNKILDIAAITSLNRPGPMENMPSFIRRKIGKEDINYYHPILKPILEETYGIIIYQEQVMEVARKIAGYSLGEADLLRRAMGKKIKEEMEKQSAVFVDRAEKVGLVSRDEAKKLFDVIEKFAGYGFNKAHAVSYTIISYQTAYLKAHYPVEFMVSLMNLDINKTDKLSGFVAEAKNMGIEILPPNVNISTAEFSCYNGKIVYALGAIKGMGVELAKKICDIRNKIQIKRFVNLQDFFNNCGHLLNKKVIESLVKSGSWKCLGVNIKTILENEQAIVNTALEFTRRTEEQKSTVVINMFGENDNLPQIPLLKQYDEYSLNELSALEFEIFGFYMSIHPLDNYRGKIEKYNFEEAQDVLETNFNNETRILMCGVITKITMRFRNKKKFAFVHLLDLSGMYETTIFNDDLINEHTDDLQEGRIVALEINARTAVGTGTRLNIAEIYDINDFFVKFPNPKDVKLGLNKNKKKSSENNINDKNKSVPLSTDDISINNDNKISKTIVKQNSLSNNLSKINTIVQTKQNISTIIKPENSKIYRGVVSNILEPKNAHMIKIDKIEKLQEIKQQINNGVFKEFDNIILQINDSEIVLKKN